MRLPPEDLAIIKLLAQFPVGTPVAQTYDEDRRDSDVCLGDIKIGHVKGFQKEFQGDDGRLRVIVDWSDDKQHYQWCDPAHLVTLRDVIVKNENHLLY